jgi:ribosomal protein S8
MMINDPLSDMIARIRNAHMRKRSKVLTPASRLRQRVLDVLQDEGYIRGYALVQNPVNSRSSRSSSNTSTASRSSPRSPACPSRAAASTLRSLT